MICNGIQSQQPWPGKFVKYPVNINLLTAFVTLSMQVGYEISVPGKQGYHDTIYTNIFARQSPVAQQNGTKMFLA